jgi:DNA-directed RNA polymerase specialized sigma24 family protein
VDREKQWQRPRDLFETWEVGLVERTARGIDTNEREELIAELMLHLLQLKRAHQRRARHWKAFLRTSIRNRALNWVRHLQVQRTHMRPFEHADRGLDRPADLEDLLAGPDPDLDRQQALVSVQSGLDPRLREFWQALVEENGHQGRAARRLRIHRNTARLWIQRIREQLQRHGF